MLIALTGLTSRTGVTTTAVALADSWPGPQPALVVEADPAGGSLAHLTGADPHRGLASLSAATTASPGSRVGGHIWDHVQVVGRVPFLAAPEHPAAVSATLSAPVTATPHSSGPRLADLAVIADCGVLDPVSPAAPIIVGADVALVIVRGDLTDPASIGRQVRELTVGCRRCAVLMVGSPDASELTERLGVPRYSVGSR
ncbi:hypothetical protein GCM10011588_39240 [Nocardia jinanensis]|uniref:CpsD/CapB family tyrosine-protein kinase n=1 Tax=Nocardia jinanensis TaxID=382504 RepID=A0A917RRZ4_9NOCA|nr:hypothetical protein GCM10011588_39240 [Nocardia jinanensis]